MNVAKQTWTVERGQSCRRYSFCFLSYGVFVTQKLIQLAVTCCPLHTYMKKAISPSQQNVLTRQKQTKTLYSWATALLFVCPNVKEESRVTSNVTRCSHIYKYGHTTRYRNIFLRKKSKVSNAQLHCEAGILKNLSGTVLFELRINIFYLDQSCVFIWCT